ncbi:alginate export family protein [Algimonas porphyrae]|uniref:alginate export family protein n=1 Tax=Algimonas porphyrae TaxID=1128113 RepID=UPI0024E128F3|nr:alginate export family protein [Algimonas porphyrae]
MGDMSASAGLPGLFAWVSKAVRVGCLIGVLGMQSSAWAQAPDRSQDQTQNQTHNQAPFRLETAVNAPDWLTLRGETRMRYETLDGQFRAGGSGGDQLLLFRSLLLVEADTGPVSFGIELQDSRTYLGDADTPLSSSFTNPLDVLQLYARMDALPGLLGQGSDSQLVLGRQTVSIGSKRQIERVSYANVIKSFTGAHWTHEATRGDQLHLVYVVPTGRFPDIRADLDANRLSGDEEQWGRRIWGVHYRRPDILPGMVSDLWGELFAYGLNERDTSDVPTPNRSYVAPGARLYRKPIAGRWDLDVEGALRQGRRRATSDPGDTQPLDVNAAMLIAVLGYVFDAPWQPRLSLEYYFASGDDDPNDLDFDQHERLFGGRRTDLNNTSIYGPLTPANLSALGFRVQVTPNARWDGWFQYHAASLASDTDQWVIARLRDPSGQSGDFIGHTLDARARYWLVPDNLRLELGASALIYGGFTKDVPDGPDGDVTLFGYAQATISF